MVPITTNPARALSRLYRIATTAVTLAIAPVALAATLTAQQPSTATLFRGARVFDGERVLERHDVLVENGAIIRMGRGLRVPAGATVVDARERTLLPGLIDSHTHTFGDALQEAVVFGVTTQLDMFTDVHAARAAREQQARGEAAGRADLFSAGTLVTAPGGHGTQFGITIPTISSPDVARAFVDARIAEGSDWIKVVYEDGHAVGMNFRSIDRATLRAVIDAAHERGKRVVVHVSDAASAQTAIEEGADGLAHLFIDREADPGFARLAASRRAFVIPTLVVLKSMGGQGGGTELVDDARLAPYLAPVRSAALRQGYPQRPGVSEQPLAAPNATIRQLKAAGVPILAGSDAPNPGTSYGAALHGELSLLVEAGLTPLEALRAATSAPARAFGLADRGHIAPGLRADLLLVDGDPTRDITATRAIAGVWKGGVPIDRDGFARGVAAANAAMRRGVAGLTDGLTSDFEDGQVGAALGSWMPSADNIAGGRSTGELAIAEGGAEGSRYALRIHGTISDAVPYAWYGAMWAPAPQPMAPIDLSTTPKLSFWTRGDGGTYRVMVFAQSRGMTPLMKTFRAGPEWQEVSFAWTDFGIDGRDVTGVVFAGGPRPGPFEFRIDRLRLR